MMKRMMLAALAGATMLTAAPAMAQSTMIDFEGKVIGSAVGTTYSAQGITFSDALFKQCGGGCPSPANGSFISSSDFRSPFTATFSGTAKNFSFANVSNSSGFAQAFNTAGTLLETVNFSSFPGTFNFTSNNIASVTFGSNGQFGVDDFAFTLSSGVPEPATWGMMILGFGAMGVSMRRRRSQVSTRVRFA